MLAIIDEKLVIKDSSLNTINTQELKLGAIDCKISGDSSKLAVTSFDYIMRIYNLDNMSDTVNIETNPYDSWKVVQDYEGKKAYTAGDAGKIYTYDAESGELLSDLRATEDHFISSLAINEVGDLAFGNSNGGLHIMGADSGQISKCETDHFKYIRSVEYNFDYSKILVASDDLQISIYDYNAGKTVSVLSGHHNTINCLSANPKDSTFVSCSTDKTLKVWDIRQKTFVDSITSSHDVALWSCKFSSDGKSIYSGTENGYFSVLCS